VAAITGTVVQSSSVTRRKQRRRWAGPASATANCSPWRSATSRSFLTADRNLASQQDLSAFDIAIVVLVARSNRLEDLRALVPRLLEVLPSAARRAVTLVQG